MDKWIDEVGSKNVIRVVTDNASNDMAAQNSLMIRDHILSGPRVQHIHLILFLKE